MSKDDRNKLPSRRFLRACFFFDEKTARFFWKKRPRSHFNSQRGWKVFNSSFPGKEALKSVNTPGYRWGLITKRRYLAHRIVWKLKTGKEPPAIIDHIDRNKLNNRWSNLRASDYSSNQLNSVCCWSIHGVKGIRTRYGKWEARIHKSKKYFHLGTFASKAQAIVARKAAEKNFYGEFVP